MTQGVQGEPRGIPVATAALGLGDVRNVNAVGTPGPQRKDEPTILALEPPDRKRRGLGESA